MSLSQPLSMFKKSVLAEGLSLVTEQHPWAKSCHLGLFVKTGTRHEPTELSGGAHFIEHMVFKGTKDQTAQELLKSIESVGGDINAHTTREYTCYTVQILEKDIERALKSLTDLCFFAEFRESDFETEQKVILNELLMSMDLLEEWIFDLYFEKAYQAHKLGMPILGSAESLVAMTPHALKKYYKKTYSPDQMVLSVTGPVDHDKIKNWFEAFFKKHKFKKLKRPSEAEPTQYIQPQVFKESLLKNSEQIHALWSLPAVPFGGEGRFEAYILNSYLGGGMTSKLYQKLREDHGLAYNVYTVLHSFVDSGSLLIYAGMSPESFDEVKRLMLQELEQLKTNFVSQEDLNFYKSQVEGQILMGADDLDNRMNSLGINEQVFGVYKTPEDVIQEINSVTTESLKAYIQKYMNLDQLSELRIGPQV